jgi:glucokinase-like ROK family protein
MRILCADIGGTSIKLGIVTDEGEIFDFTEVPTEGKKGGARVIENLISGLQTFEGYDAIGISTAGQVDREKGSIIYANDNIPGYTGTQVKDILEKRFKRPVEVENDVNCAALGEGWLGAGKGLSDYLCLTYGTGIGGAIILGGKLYRGIGGSAGEFGHMILHPGGRDCSCGMKGCYEAYASARLLVEMAAKADPTVTNGRELFSRISEGDGLMKGVLEEWSNDAATGLASLVHIFNPQALILGGGILEQDAAAESIEKKSRELIMESFQGVAFLKAILGNKAGLFGAATLHIK